MFAKFTFKFRISVDHEFEGIHIAAIEQIIFRINKTNYKVGINKKKKTKRTNKNEMKTKNHHK